MLWIIVCFCWPKSLVNDQCRAFQTRIKSIQRGCMPLHSSYEGIRFSVQVGYPWRVGDGPMFGWDEISTPFRLKSRTTPSPSPDTLITSTFNPLSPLWESQSSITADDVQTFALLVSRLMNAAIRVETDEAKTQLLSAGILLTKLTFKNNASARYVSKCHVILLR